MSEPEEVSELMMGLSLGLALSSGIVDTSGDMTPRQIANVLARLADNMRVLRALEAQALDDARSATGVTPERFTALAEEMVRRGRALAKIPPPLRVVTQDDSEESPK